MKIIKQKSKSILQKPILEYISYKNLGLEDRGLIKIDYERHRTIFKFK